MNKPQRQHFVTFYSPGTFVSEQTTKPIKAWDISKAVTMSKRITERYNAKPYGFRFSTSLVAQPVPDGEGGTLRVEPKEVKTSGTHFLGGRLRTIDDVRADAKKAERILLSNMECNDIAVIVENTNSYLSTLPFSEKDILLADDGTIADRGDSPKWAEYRAVKKAEHEAELAKQRAEWKARERTNV
jgi:hypothetical protein